MDTHLPLSQFQPAFALKHIVKIHKFLKLLLIYLKPIEELGH